MIIDKKIFALLGICGCLLGCTISVSQVHTEGEASDVIDENQEATADVSPNLNIPVKPL